MESLGSRCVRGDRASGESALRCGVSLPVLRRDVRPPIARTAARTPRRSAEDALQVLTRPGRCASDFGPRGGCVTVLACRGLSLLLDFSGKRSFDGCAGLCEARGRGNDLGKRRGRLGKERVRRLREGASDVASRHRGQLQGLVMVEQPSRQDGLGRLLDPLVNQNADLVAQIGSVVQTSEFKTLQRSARSRLEIVGGRRKTGNGHGQSSQYQGWAERAGQ